METTEERIGAALHAIRSLVPATDAERHLRRVARDLQIALGIEDGEDALYFLHTLEAWPDILFLSEDVTGAARANALVRFCLDEVAEHQRRCRHAMVTLRALPEAGPGDSGAPALH